MNLIKTVDGIHIVNDMAEGLLARIYLAKGKLLLPEFSALLNDPEMLKIRFKLEKKYPILPDFQKAGGDAFMENLDLLLERFAQFYELVVDLLEYSTTAKNLFKELTVSVLDFKISKNRGLIILLLDLLCGYVKVMMLFETVTERKSIVAMFHAASQIADNNRNDPFANGIKLLFDDVENLRRHFIDSFSGSQTVLNSVIVQLRESLAFANNSEELRSHNVLNPTNSSDQMGMPAVKNLAFNVSAYTEIQYAAKYYDYVVFSVLACPSLLFDENVLDILQMVTDFRALIPLYRELTVNVHIELEKISLVFPSASDVFKIPKGFKLKNVLKKLSRDSIAAVAANQCGRRSFIEAELSTLNKLILVVPGVIAPKFPMLIAAAAVAKSEIEAYFCHVEGFAVRKDTKGQYDGKKFASPDICILLSTLYQTVSIVRKYQQLIIDYYTEYLVVNDLGKITKYCEACAESLNTLAPYFEAFVSDISELENAPVVCGNDNDYRSNHHIAHKNLEALRYNWERVLALSSGQQMALLVKSTESFDALRERISAVVIRSLYIDSMEILLKNFFDPYNIGWHRKVLLQSFTTTYKDPHGLAIHSFAYFKPLESVQLNTHLDCPEESKAIGESAKAVSNLMLNDMCAYLLTLLKYLWDYVSALESHCHPVEAAKRLEKAMLMKKGNEGGQVASAFESLPGTESEFWAKESIEKFVFIRRNLSLLMAAAEKIDKIQVYTREYFPSVFFLKHITKYFQARFNSVFTVGDRMNRPSLCLDKIICGCRAVQYVLGFIDADISLTMKEFLFTQFNDLLIAPPGVPTPLDVELAGTTVIYKIANSFVDFVNSIRALDSCLLYVPSQESFVNAVKKKYLKREDYDKASPLSLDLHLDREELAKLATIIGAQGVRAIDSQLLNMVTTQIAEILSFLEKYESNLEELSKNYCLGIGLSLGVQGIDVLFDALITIGVIFAVREALYTGLEKTCRSRFSDTFIALKSATTAIDPWANPLLATPLLSLASAMGITTEMDFALAATLAQLNLTDRELDLLKLFPVGAATSFMSGKWLRSDYIPEIEAFDNNEHCMQLAISKLLMSFYYILNLRKFEMHATNVKTETVSSQISKKEFHDYVETYVKISSQVLLVQRNLEHAYSPHYPYRPMFIMLEYFSKLISPLIGRSCLEKYMPNAILHADLTDISLGRQRLPDVLHTFIHDAQML